MSHRNHQSVRPQPIQDPYPPGFYEAVRWAIVFALLTVALLGLAPHDSTIVFWLTAAAFSFFAFGIFAWRALCAAT